MLGPRWTISGRVAADAASASFVSVTQAFNTTTSMGRLTLNVLLSFAQFEREVTGERIRDKIAASKARGMWMGGVVPLGYSVESRKLVIAEDEAETVRMIFQRYLKLGSVLAVNAELDSTGLTGRARTLRGELQAPKPMSRSALYLLLQNRIYLGEIGHKGVTYPGEHQPVVPNDLFDQVQQLLAANRIGIRDGRSSRELSLLAGLLYDAHGRRMSPSHATKQVKRYRYYVSRAEGERSPPIWRVPAGDLEELITGRLVAFLSDEGAFHESMSAPDDDAQTMHDSFYAARKLARELNAATPGERRRMLVAALRKVVVHEKQVELHLSGSLARTLCSAGHDDDREPR